MATLLDTLKAVSGYPITANVFQSIALMRSIELDAKATTENTGSRDFQLAKADLLNWVSLAPNVSQGGISYAMSDSDREQLRERANTVYGELGDTAYKKKVTYGYKGNRL